jgi:hypothetical protein
VSVILAPLRALAVALLSRLGLLRRAVTAGPAVAAPPAAPPTAAALPLLPLLSLGLPGRYTPQTGGLP